MKKILSSLSAWIQMSRPPFHIVGVLPFALGTLLAWRIEHIFSGPVFFLGTLAVVLIMLSTYHAGEYFDYREDAISKKLYPSRFSGGSGIIPAEKLPRRVALWTSVVAIVLAGTIGIMLQFYFRTGPYTILLGSLGLFPGFFYSTRPIRLIEKGIGEIFIGFCYGWLPIACAYYIQTGSIAPVIHWIGLPVGITIFNVVFLNEFPDYVADKATGKRNLLVRMGIKRGPAVYIAASILAAITTILAILEGVPARAFYLYIPVMALSAVIIYMILNRKHEDRSALEILCGLNIAINLGTTGSFLLAFM
jgi:1,4-dihydroxy-2-naphthoate polyprenyltransferase